MDDDNNNNLPNSRKTKWLIGVPAIAVIGVILIVYISTNIGSSPSSVSTTYLSNTPKLVPAVAPGASGCFSSSNYDICRISYISTSIT